ncbi:MAG: DUF4350 domain-containing protein [Sulfolobales archaeon]|nr:DUF4350 domain-containing protein [Sulfolobales archaeon]
MPAVAVKALGALALAVLIPLVVLAAVLEYVDLPAHYSPGSSPINPGQFGTSAFVEMLRDYGMRIVYVSNWSYLRTQKFERGVCVLIVSPEYDYVSYEVESMARVLTSSGGVLVVADETPTSNTIFEYLGLRVRIYGNRLLDEYYDLHPRALFRVNDREIALRLDKASEILNCSTTIGVAESYEYSTREVKLKPVGCLERVGNVTSLILGDGSLLTNQVLELGGMYRELAKYVALTIRKYCGANCLVLVEAGKYVPNRDLFLKLYMRSENSEFFLLLNDAVHYLKSADNLFKIRLLEGLEEETVFVLVLIAITALYVKLGRRAEPARSGSYAWKSREDFKKLLDAMADTISLLGCGHFSSRELVLCLEKAGYEPDSSRKLAKFIEFSNFVLNREFFKYVPIWKFMVNSAIKHSEKLLEVLEKSLLGERAA